MYIPEEVKKLAEEKIKKIKNKEERKSCQISLGYGKHNRTPR